MDKNDYPYKILVQQYTLSEYSEESLMCYMAKI